MVGKDWENGFKKIGGKRLEIGTKWLNKKLVENDLKLGQNG